MLKTELNNLTIKDLKEYCKRLKIELKTTYKKDDLVNFIFKSLKKVRFCKSPEKIKETSDKEKKSLKSISGKDRLQKILKKETKKSIDKKETKKSIISEQSSKSIDKEKQLQNIDEKETKKSIISEQSSKSIDKEKQLQKIDKKETKKNIDEKIEKPKSNQNLYDKQNIKKIGYEGKDAEVFEVFDIYGNIFAMKKYKKNVKKEDIKKEIDFLSKLANSNITPKLYDVNYKEKYIIIEKFDKTLFDEINEKNKLSQKLQKEILNIHKILDSYNVFHGDPSPLNMMLHNNKLKVIDFGFSREIDDNLKKELNTNNPNYEISTLGLIIKIKDQIPLKDLDILSKILTKQQLNLLN